MSDVYTDTPPPLTDIGLTAKENRDGFPQVVNLTMWENATAPISVHRFLHALFCLIIIGNCEGAGVHLVDTVSHNGKFD